MQYSPRFSRRYEQASRKQAIALIFGSVAILGLFIFVGVPLLFKLSDTIMDLRPKSIVVEKEIAPMPPLLFQTYLATNSASLTIHGNSQPHSLVEIWQNDIIIQTVPTNNEGQFQYDARLQDGSNRFAAKAILESGKARSSLSNTVVVNYSWKGPTLEVGTLAETSESPHRVTGKTDKNASVTVGGHYAIVSNDGTFSYLLNLNQGENIIKIVSTDLAGNYTEKEVTIKYSTH